MTKKIIKAPRKELPKKLRERITLEPVPSQPALEAMAIFPNLLEKYQKESLSAALRNADHQFFESMGKLCLLCEHYGLQKDDPNKWLFLAFYIARDWHPGFKIQTKAKAGRKKSWDEALLVQLYIDVQEKRVELKKGKRHVSYKTIFDQLAKEERWRAHTVKSKDGGDLLHDTYLKSKKSPSVMLLTHLFDYVEKTDQNERLAIFETLKTFSEIFPRNSC